MIYHEKALRLESFFDIFLQYWIAIQAKTDDIELQKKLHVKWLLYV